MYNRIKCEAIKVNAASGVCPGVAETKLGEMYTIGARTPVAQGICCQALIAFSSWKLALTLTDKMAWESETNKNYCDIVCPHGVVTFRLSRV